MKRIFRLLTVLLCFCLSFAVCGCSDGGIVGKWQCEMNYADFVNSLCETAARGSGLMPENGTFRGIEHCDCDVVFRFSEDGSYTCSPVYDTAADAVKKIYPEIVAAFEELLAQSAEQIGAESAEELLASMQMNSAEELVLRLVGKTELIKSIAATSFCGDYREEGTKLYLGTGENGAISEEKYLVATVILDTLTVSESHGYTEAEDPFLRYPASLKRIK